MPVNRNPMEAWNCALFDTALGCCGVAWGPAGVRAMQLPESNADATRLRLLRRAPGAVDAVAPPDVQQAIDGVVALLRGDTIDLSFVALDMRGLPDLQRRAYEVARAIPQGLTLSYGQVAERLGSPHLARAVGQAMARNPFAPVVPCHRVLGARGQAGGFSARGGLLTKWRLLRIEGANWNEEPHLFSGSS